MVKNYSGGNVAQKRMLANAIQIEKPRDFEKLMPAAPLYKIAVGPTFAIVYPNREMPNQIEFAFTHLYTVGNRREAHVRNMLAMLHDFAVNVLPVGVRFDLTFRSMDSFPLATLLTNLGFKAKGAEDLTAINFADYKIPPHWRIADTTGVQK